jgi:hypothetical protein
MKIKIFYLLTVLIIFSNLLYAIEANSTESRIALGLSGGVSQDKSFSGEIYGGATIPEISNKLEANIGYLFFTNKTEYVGVNELEFSSHGLFIEGNYYFINGFYGGVRFALNFNWVDKESQEKFETYPDTDSPTFFTGNAIYGHFGYNLPISERVGIKLQGQIGLHNYQITEGWILIETSSDDFSKSEMGIESNADLLYNLSIGLNYRLQ